MSFFKGLQIILEKNLVYKKADCWNIIQFNQLCFNLCLKQDGASLNPSHCRAFNPVSFRGVMKYVNKESLLYSIFVYDRNGIT